MPCSCFNPGLALLDITSTPNLHLGAKKNKLLFPVHRKDIVCFYPEISFVFNFWNQSQAYSLLLCAKDKKILEGWIFKIRLLQSSWKFSFLPAGGKKKLSYKNQSQGKILTYQNWLNLSRSIVQQRKWAY